METGQGRELKVVNINKHVTSSHIMIIPNFLVPQNLLERYYTKIRIALLSELLEFD